VNEYEDEVLGKAYDARLMKRLLRYVRPHRGLVFLAAAALLAFSLIDLVTPWLVREAVDGPIADVREGRLSLVEGLDGLMVIGGVFLGIVVVGLLIRFSHMWLTEYIGQRVMVDVRHQVFAKIQRLSLRYFDRNPVGRLVTRVVSDIEALNQALSSGLVSIFGDLVKILALAGILLFVNWTLALWLFSVLPLLVVLSLRFRRRAREAYRHDNAVSAILTYWPSEFSQVRGQLRRTQYAEGVTANEFLFQFQYVLGAHGAHTF